MTEKIPTSNEKKKNGEQISPSNFKNLTNSVHKDFQLVSHNIKADYYVSQIFSFQVQIYTTDFHIENHYGNGFQH